MTETDIKNVLYGSIRELTKSRTYYYSGYRSQWTDEGRKVIAEMLDLYAEKISQAITEDDEKRSKDMVMRELTKKEPTN